MHKLFKIFILFLDMSNFYCFKANCELLIKHSGLLENKIVLFCRCFDLAMVLFSKCWFQ